MATRGVLVAKSRGSNPCGTTNLKIKYMMLITGLLCLATSFLMYAVLKLHDRIVKLEEVLNSMNRDLNMISKTMDNMHKHEKAKELSKQILKG